MLVCILVNGRTYDKNDSKTKMRLKSMIECAKIVKIIFVHIMILVTSFYSIIRHAHSKLNIGHDL